MTDPLITVVVCAHNEQEFLPRCLSSLASQSVPLHEVIIVDDRSTDETHKTARSYRKHLALTVVKKKGNFAGWVGPGNVRNVFNYGLKHSDGKFDYLAKIDADIELKATYFEKLIQAFETDSKLGIAGGMIINEPEKHNVLGGNRVYRAKCWRNISNSGFLPPVSPEDTYLTAKAIVNGWKVQQTREAKSKHLRPFTKLGFQVRMRRRMAGGRVCYHFGFHPLFFLWKSVRMACIQEKFPMAIVFMVFGWIIGWLEKETVHVDSKVKHYFRETQVKWLFFRKHFRTLRKQNV